MESADSYDLYDYSDPEDNSEPLTPVFIDLTADSPTHTEREVQAAYTLESMKRRVRPQPNTTSRQVSQGPSTLVGSADAPILIDDLDEEQNDDAKALLEVLAKQREETVMTQSKLEGSKRTTLNTMSCVICMDNPTDLTMAGCGMFYWFFSLMM